MIATNAVSNSLKITKETRAEQTVEDRWRDQSRKALEDSKMYPPAHAYTGRTVEVTKDLGMAYKQLDSILSRNQVRQTLRLTERHEKKGVKRRRLRSERWRKQFANEVRKKVQLVMKIRDRGA
ncbi:hypothetical protein NLJ89_g689 [Agrocybe chaxingu]|uniref:Ribosomal protein S21 n=1 Tax=Agrocybe chaxingu TaxID=84603 RepID=A0A9W8TFP4_9AGAR|nr:hypothetical protein NLJ89_g689 [Agrocybe chaxingu]